jgi:nicotinate-nucleotide--dimethylbenzimidazole phosphoribosyltransferase
MNFSELNQKIRPYDQAAADRAVAQWNSIAMPIGSLGVLEDDVVRIAGITGSEDIDISRRVVLAMCADNGVVAQGVTQTGQEVTGLVASNMVRNCSSVCQMAKPAHADVVPVDVGIASPVEGIVDKNVMRGTNDMTLGPAMSREQAEAGVRAGIDMVHKLVDEGYGIIVTGEMGIGNTTTSSALVSALMGADPEVVTGKGAGLSDEGLVRKVAAIRKAIEVNKPDAGDALDCLAKVGGLDIAGMAGTFIGGALEGVPVIVDGFVSLVAALVAVRLCPGCRPFMLASHVSAEPAARMVMDELGLSPVITAGMRLGEGTGAVCLLPLLDMTLMLYRGTTFAATGMDAYDEELV